MKIGSAISFFATPVAGWMGLDCYDPQTKNLRPESGCAKRRDALDNFPWFWSTAEVKSNGMKEYGVQLIIKAENLTEIEAKLPKDVQIVMVQERPPKPPTPVPAPRPIPGSA